MYQIASLKLYKANSTELKEAGMSTVMVIGNTFLLMTKTASMRNNSCGYGKFD